MLFYNDRKRPSKETVINRNGTNDGKNKKNFKEEKEIWNEVMHEIMDWKNHPD